MTIVTPFTAIKTPVLDKEFVWYRMVSVNNL